MKITIDPPFEKIAGALNSIDIKFHLRQNIREIGFGIERFAKQLAPVDTGYMRSRIETEIYPLGFGAEVEAKADYSGFVHFGTSRMRARPFLYEGAALFLQGFSEGKVADRLDNEFRKAFKKL